MRQAFTLLELSIVLVIIGLLIGGIFVGQSLIHTAQLNAVISEFNRYQTAVQNFKQQYQALPGDMNNATSFWGIAGGTGSDATCMAVVSTTAATCNGNGDGTIGTSATAADETYRFWQHLSNAKMVEGFYSGSITAVPGVTLPASKYGSNTEWIVFFGPTYAAGNATMFATDYGTGHAIYIANPTGIGMSPKDAWTVDKKYDDGKPAFGNILLYNWPAPCSNAANNAVLTSTYTLSTTSASCGLIFLTSF